LNQLFQQSFQSPILWASDLIVGDFIFQALAAQGFKAIGM